MNKNDKPQSQELRDEIDIETKAADAEEINESENTAATGETEAVASSSAEEGNDEVDTVSDTEPTSDEIEEDGDLNSNSESEKAVKAKKIRRDTRRLRYGGIATAMTCIVVAAVVLLNVIVGILNDRFPLNFDLTSDKLFTLSDQSKELAKKIREETDIIVFSEKNQFSAPSTPEEDLNTILKQFYETTKQYESLSGGKIKVTYVDLVGNPANAAKYKQYEPVQGDILFRCGNRFQKVSMNDLLTYDEESAMYYNQLTGVTSEVEVVLSSNIAMVTSEDTPIITVLTGHTEDENLLAGVKSVLGKNNYKIEDLDITGSAKFNQESTVALIAAPKKDYSADEIEKLRKWLNNDGKLSRHLAVFIDYSADCPELYKFLNVEYGIEVTNNLIVETDENRISGYYSSNIFGDVSNTDYTADLSGEKAAIMPTARQIITHKEDTENNALSNVDLVTFPESSRLVNLADLAENEEPKQEKADEYPVVGMAYAKYWQYDNDAGETIYTNVLVNGCSGAFYAQSMSFTITQNEKLLVSLFNGFTGNKNPITISSKPLEKTSLEFTQGQQNIFFMIFVAVIPIALLIIGIVVFIRRRRL